MRIDSRSARDDHEQQGGRDQDRHEDERAADGNTFENGAPSASAATPTATTIASAPRVQRSAIPPPAPGDSAPIGSRVGGRLPRTRVPVLRVGYLVGREANESLNVIDEQGQVEQISTGRRGDEEIDVRIEIILPSDG